MLAAKISVKTGRKKKKKKKEKYIFVFLIFGNNLYNYFFIYLVTFAGAVLFLIFGVYYGYHAYQGQLE